MDYFCLLAKLNTEAEDVLPVDSATPHQTRTLAGRRSNVMPAPARGTACRSIRPEPDHRQR